MQKDKTEINIRKAQRKDLPAILEIENRSFGDERFNARQFLYLMNHACGLFLVALHNDQITGYISLLKHEGRNNLRIYSVAVHPDARGLHIGDKLIAQSIACAKENHLQRITLEVDIENTAAIGLYEKNGFEKIGILKDYYGDGRDAYYMQREVDDER